MESLGFLWNVIDTKWEKQFTALQNYKLLHGDCDVPSDWTENPQLGIWCDSQRQYKKKHKLSEKRIHRLNSLGFVWNERDTQWDEMYSALERYKTRYGNCNVPYLCDVNPELGRWVANQRARRDRLGPDRIGRLEHLGFAWEVFDGQWEEQYTELKKYRTIYGDCNVPQKFPENPVLGVWCSHQRRFRKRGKLSEDRIRRLSSLDFDWEPFDTRWESKFAELKQYKALHADCGVPDKWNGNPLLANWVRMQRAAKIKGTLAPNKLMRLEAIGFIWSPYETMWQSFFSRLVAYKTKHGHCNVPAQWSNDPKLGIWVAQQRRAKKTGHCSDDHAARLDELGFLWDGVIDLWEKRFSELKEYKAAHGNCDVPQNWPENPSLGLWCCTQRQYKKRHKMPDERIRNLGNIGFVWEPNEAVEKKMLAALFAFRATHGHCNVPRGWPDNPQLSGWCHNQRQLRKARRLSEDLIYKLENVGFSWDVRKGTWEDMFAALSAYKVAHGNCNVPQAWRVNRKLGQWCSNQRESKKQEKLSEERIKRLEDIGFQWKICCTKT